MKVAALQAKWQPLATRFAALVPREKYLIIGATVFTILFGGYSLWIEPAQIQKARLAKMLEQQRNEAAQLEAQLKALGTPGDPDAGNRVALEQLKQALVAADRDIHSFDRVLVSPREAPALLQTLLGRHRGLSLVSLTTLPPQPLVARTEKKPEEASAKAAAPSTTESPSIYKHGIEIRIAGSYLDLLSYVAELETGSQKLLWGGIKLASPTDKHPVGELTLTVFTLSLESIWLAV